MKRLVFNVAYIGGLALYMYIGKEMGLSDNVAIPLGVLYLIIGLIIYSVYVKK